MSQISGFRHSRTEFRCRGSDSQGPPKNVSTEIFDCAVKVVRLFGRVSVIYHVGEIADARRNAANNIWRKNWCRYLHDHRARYCHGAGKVSVWTECGYTNLFGWALPSSAFLAPNLCGACVVLLVLLPTDGVLVVGLLFLGTKQSPLINARMDSETTNERLEMLGQDHEMRDWRLILVCLWMASKIHAYF